MKRCLAMIIWLTFVTQKVTCIKCAECNYLPHSSISGIRTCSENCYGDICFIVVNNYYNETLIAGCVNVDNDTRSFFHDQAYCYEKSEHAICGCTTLDRCNSPQAPFSMFTFLTTPFFEDCQFLPKHGLFPVHLYSVVIVKSKDRDCDSFQCNITLKDNNSAMKFSLKAQAKEDERDANIIEITTKNVDITDQPSAIVKSKTSQPTVSYSMKGIESVRNGSGHVYSDNGNEITSKFVDEVVRGLLPSTDLQRFTDPEFNYSEFNDQTRGRKKSLCRLKFSNE
uniref:Protein sleepless n=1 Tax=Elaeophora elaphi TaxID=1147741 RepID=A0A0R3S0D4_9BILA